MNIDYFKNIHFIECENWCNAYGYEKAQMKEDTINYIKQLEQENKELREENNLLKKQLGDRTKYIFVTECSAEQNSYFMPLAEYLDMKELPEDYEDIEYVELTDEELDYLEDCGRDLKITDMKQNLNLRKYYKIRDMFENGVVDLEELKNIVLGDDK